MKKLDLLMLAGVMAAVPALPIYGDAPADWIPMWSEQDGKGFQTCIIHTDNIVSIHPVYDESTLMKRSPKINHLDVYLTDGRMLTIFEDFEEFKKRITKHNR